MRSPRPVPERRADALTRERVVDAAIELLDSTGESGLTFRALAARLQTGHGAIQWHVATKGELLKAATASTVADSVGCIEQDAAPREAVHAIARGVFDAIDAHPWLGRQLAGSPWQPTMLWIFELIGRQVRRMTSAPTDQFDAASALLTYVIGAAGRETANAQAPEAAGPRQDLLEAMATSWEQLDAEEYVFTRAAADALRKHDDHAVFRAGIDLILDGIARGAEPERS